MRRSPLARRTPLKRGGWLRRGSRRPLEPGSAQWRDQLGACVVCPAEGAVCSGPVQGHHAISRQTLRRHGLTAYVFDVRNRMPVCEFRHEQHTTGFRPIPRSVLPLSVFVFAREVGLLWWIDKHYPAEAVA